MKPTLSNIKYWISSNIRDYLILRYSQNGVYPDIEIENIFHDLFEVWDIKDTEMDQELTFKKNK